MAQVGKHYEFGDAIYSMILQMIKNETMGYSQGGRLALGSGPGEDGGDDDSPRPIVGQLAQRRVAYDTTQREHPGLRGELVSGWENSLVDNLNHIRYWHRPARWFEPAFDGSYTVTVNEGFYWTSASQYLAYDGGDVVMSPPSAAGERLDVLYVTKAGEAGVSQGTPVASGIPTATYPALDHIPVAEIFIKASGDATITVPGIDYYYASGTCAGYILRDVRPFFGNTDDAADGVEYLADLLDVTSDTPEHLDILTYDDDIAKWKPLQWVMGGIGGGQPTLQVDGPISALTHVGGAYITTRSGEINSVYIYCEDPGTSGDTLIDVNLNSITVFQPQSNRPSLAYNDADQIQRSVTITGAIFDPGELITVDIDEAAVEASGLTVVVALDIPDDHPHSGGPHTGVLNEWEIRDSAVSGYPLVGDGKSPLGGPSYKQLGTVGIAANAVTYAKLGGGAGKVSDRQGGNASDWSDGGSTDYDLSATNIKIQVGSADVTVPGSSGSNPWKHKSTVTVTFPEGFAGGTIPLVLTQVVGATGGADTELYCAVDVVAISATEFTFYAGISNDADQTFEIHWLAIGAE